MDNRKSQNLIRKIKEHNGNVVVEGFGPGLFGKYALGKVSFIKANTDNMDALPKLLNTLDDQAKGRQTSAMIDFFVDGPFITSKTGKEALLQHQVFARILSYPKDFIKFTIEELEKLLQTNDRFVLDDFVRKPAMAALIHGMFHVPLDQSSELSEVLDVFSKIVTDINSDFYTETTLRLMATYFPILLSLKPDFRAARDQYVRAAEKFLTSQVDHILNDIQFYLGGGLASSIRNIFTLTIFELIKEKHPECREDIDKFHEHLANMKPDELKTYLKDRYLRTIPGSVTAGANLVILNSCALVALEQNKDLLKALREELSAINLFADNSSERMQKVIENNRRQNGLLHRVYLESLRRESMLKSPERLEYESNIWRYTDTDIPFGGEVVPKNSAVAIMNALPRFDRKIWDHPEAFRPERFATANPNTNKFLAKIPESGFSYGHRVCPSHKISEYMLKIFLAYVVENFDWKLEYKENCAPNLANVHIQLTKRQACKNEMEQAPEKNSPTPGKF